MKKLVVSLLNTAFTVLLAAGIHADGVFAPFRADSLSTPCERWVITSEELSRYNIHSLYDVLKLVPGLSFWIMGSDGALSGFSIDGAGGMACRLYVNGEAVLDPYTQMSLVDFVPVSRIRYIEVYYNGSPFFAGGSSPGGFINVVTYEGGLGGPRTDVEFTYGKSNRRARRAWFSTPDAHFNLTLAYDEYLHDAAEVYVPISSRKLGQYDMRSVLLEAVMKSKESDRLLVRLHRFDEGYTGTWMSNSDEILSSGFDSQVRYRRGGFALMLRQGRYSIDRVSGTVSCHYYSSRAYKGLRVGGLNAAFFMNGNRYYFENVLWGKAFSPSLYNFEGGVTAFKGRWDGLLWKGSVFAGYHSEVFLYSGGDVSVTKLWGRNIRQSLYLGRKVGTPSAEELYQPVLSRTVDGEERVTSGSTSLPPLETDEVALSFDFGGRAGLSFFVKDLKSVVMLPDSEPAVYSAVYGGGISGVRSYFMISGSLFGNDISATCSLDGYFRRSRYVPGVPEYRAFGSIYIKRKIFKGTELLTVGLNGEFVGRRDFYGLPLDEYFTVDLFSTLTIMSARLHFQWRNIFDEEYETYPDYRMPGSRFIVGIYWKLID